MKYYVVIDIGGTSIKHGVINEEMTFMEKGEVNTEASQGGGAILQKAMGLVSRYWEQYCLAGICVSTAGVVDVEKGEITYADPLIAGYAKTRIKEEMEKKFQVPCEVENDVNCAGLSEYFMGAAKGASISLCLTIGTGIGGCIIIDGNVIHGHSYSACEVGHLNMFGTEFQKLGAASVLIKNVEKRKNCPPGTLNGKIVFGLAKEGDMDCVKAIDEMIDVLGYGIANICYCINPEVVVLGGGIMAERAYLEKRIRNAVDHYLLDHIARNTRLAFAENKNAAGMLGAYLHFISMQKKR